MSGSFDLPTLLQIRQLSSQAKDKALGVICMSGSFDLPTLLQIRQLSRQAKGVADKALGDMLSSQKRPESASFWGPPPGLRDCGPVEICNRLRRLCTALGKPPNKFTLAYVMIIDCRRRRKILTAQSLSFLTELCNIGIHVALMVRVVSGKLNLQINGVSREFLTGLANLRKDISLSCLTELYISGKDVMAHHVLYWLLQCGMPQLNRLSHLAFTGTLLRAWYYAPTLINKFSSSLPKLTDLSLPLNKLSGKSLQMLTVLTGLTNLNLSESPLYPDEMHYLVSVLDSMRQLRNLNLSSNYFIAGLAEVAPAIPKTVTWLNLSSNGLGLGSLAGLTLPSLTWLDLSSNALGVEGARMLPVSLLTNLTQLNLSSNALGVEGARMLPVSLLTNLTLLDLSHNGILAESPTWTPGVPWLTCYDSIDITDSKNGICLLY